MEHKEKGYQLFPDDHVQMVGFPPGFATDSHCLFRGIVKPSFKTTGSYSIALIFQATFLVHSVIAQRSWWML